LIKIKTARGEQLQMAKRLIRRVFPWRSPREEVILFAMTNRQSWIARKMLYLSRIKEIAEIWVAINEDKEVIGTVGLYTYRKDHSEAIWLFWYCVAPEERGQGTGKKLLKQAIQEAKKLDIDYLRLYTSNLANERVAQQIYEKHGLKEIRRKNRIFYQEIIRELRLQ